MVGIKTFIILTHGCHCKFMRFQYVAKKTRKGVTSKRHKSHVGKVKRNLGLPKSTYVLFTRGTTHSNTSTANYFVWIGKGAFLPAATKLGQGNIFTGVCLSTGGGGRGEGCLPQCMLGYPPGTDPPGADTPPDQAPPWEQTPPRGADPPGANTPPPPESRLQHTVNERPVRILLECILVYT